MKRKFLINTIDGPMGVIARKRVVIRGVAFAVHHSHVQCPRLSAMDISECKGDWVVSEWSTGARLAHSSGFMDLAIAVARNKLTMWQRFNKEITVAEHFRKQIKKLKIPLINRSPT